MKFLESMEKTDRKVCVRAIKLERQYTRSYTNRSVIKDWTNIEEVLQTKVDMKI